MEVTELVAGVDEAGRGPLAGPVVAAAVILGDGQNLAALKDSKLLSERQRELLYQDIITHSTAWAVGEASTIEIDRLNIRQATLLAMQRAVEGLSIRPNSVIVDGRDCPRIAIPCHAIINGDNLEPAISAASIIAKVTRDRILVQLDALYPNYGFAQHKGYGTAMHLEALRKHGATEHHRRSFAPVGRALRETEVTI